MPGVAVDDHVRGGRAERQAREVHRADAVHVADVAEALERARLPARGVGAGAQDHPQVVGLRAGGEDHLDVLQVVRRDGGQRPRLVDREPAQQRGVGAAADHDGDAEPPRLADVDAVGHVVDGDHGGARLAQEQAEPEADLAESDDDHVVGLGDGAAPDEPGEVAADEPLHEAAGERGGEQQRDQHAAEITTLNHFGPSSTSGFGSTVTSVLTAP